MYSVAKVRFTPLQAACTHVNTFNTGPCNGEPNVALGIRRWRLTVRDRETRLILFLSQAKAAHASMLPPANLALHDKGHENIIRMPKYITTTHPGPSQGSRLVGDGQLVSPAAGLIGDVGQ